MSTGTTERSPVGAEKDVYSFTLLLEGVNEITDDLERMLYDAGCDDALLSASDDEVCLDFDREASSMFEAIFNAIQTCVLLLLWTFGFFSARRISNQESGPRLGGAAAL